MHQSGLQGASSCLGCSQTHAWSMLPCQNICLGTGTGEKCPCECDWASGSKQTGTLVLDKRQWRLHRCTEIFSTPNHISCSDWDFSFLVNVRSHNLSGSTCSKGPSCPGQGIEVSALFFPSRQILSNTPLASHRAQISRKTPSPQWNEFQVLLIEGFKIPESYHEERRNI